MRDRSEWVRSTSPEPIKIKNKTYKNLVEFSRPCSQCAKPFSIFVTRKIADGLADSNSFGLKNCEAHRRNKAAGEADEKTAMVNAVMKEELDGLYATIAELKNRLALYELPAAMAAHSQIKMPWEQK